MLCDALIRTIQHDSHSGIRSQSAVSSLGMRFSTRNAFYLRASNYRVVPLFLYLDERHVRSWAILRGLC